jgi:hypothetical protein
LVIAEAKEKLVGLPSFTTLTKPLASGNRMGAARPRKLSGPFPAHLPGFKVAKASTLASSDNDAPFRMKKATEQLFCFPQLVHNKSTTCSP